MIGRRGASLDELEALYRSRFDVFARVAASVTGDSERARDAVQEAFATAVRKRRSFRGEGPLEAWVWRIVLNAARSDVRRSSPGGRVRRAGRYERPSGAGCRAARGARAPAGAAADRRLPPLLRRPRLRGDRRGARDHAPEPSPRPSMQRTRRFAADWRRSGHDRSRPHQPRSHPSRHARLG